MHLVVPAQQVAKLSGEVGADLLWPAERRCPGVLHADDHLGTTSRWEWLRSTGMSNNPLVAAMLISGPGGCFAQAMFGLRADHIARRAVPSGSS